MKRCALLVWFVSASFMACSSDDGGGSGADTAGAPAGDVAEDAAPEPDGAEPDGAVQPDDAGAPGDAADDAGAPEDAGEQDTGAVDAGPADPGSVPQEPTWTNGVGAVFQASCAGCHGWASSYATVVAKIGSVEKKVQSGHKIGGADKTLVLDWIAAGYPE